MSDPHDLTVTSSPDGPPAPTTGEAETTSPTEPTEASPAAEPEAPVAADSADASPSESTEAAAESPESSQPDDTSAHSSDDEAQEASAQAESTETASDETQSANEESTATEDLPTPESETAAAEAGSEPSAAEATAEPVEASTDDAAPAEASADASDEAATEAAAAAETDGDATETEGAGSSEAAAEAAETVEAEAEPAPPSPELQRIIDAAAAGERIKGTVIGWNKGGFHVTLNGIPAFCPKSQIELGKPRRANSYVDRTFPFAIIEIREQGKRVVVSRRKPLEEDRASTLERLQQATASGDTVEGTVRSITDFGVFVELGGIEGLVHNSQLTHKRFERANEIVQEGQPVEAKVLKIEKGGERISLSMKALEPNPWHEAAERITVGEQIEATVVRRTDFGLFMDVGSGIEGLLHESALLPGNKLDEESYQEGTAHTVWVRDIDPDRQRLALSFKEVAKGNPWANLGEKYSEGDQVEGEVEQIAKFGIFILLEPGLTGLLPFSALNLPSGARPQRLYAPGQTVKLQIDSIDTKRRRLSLAPLGSKLEGTKSDLKNYLNQQKSESTGLNAMAQAFAKMRQD